MAAVCPRGYGVCGGLPAPRGRRALPPNLAWERNTAMTTATTVAMPVNIMEWAREHRDELKPPVGNKYLYDGNDFFVMVIGGPNARNDF
ncbi:MAG: hypothetical protein ACYTAU_14490, partial [Planctomycetota bacterium]